MAAAEGIATMPLRSGVCKARSGRTEGRRCGKEGKCFHNNLGRKNPPV
jgi:hypothetical protein